MKIIFNKYVYAVIGILIVSFGIFVFHNYFGDTKLFGRTSKEAFNNDLVRQLANASARGQADKISELVNAGADVNFIGKDGATPLVWAAGNNNLRGVQSLLSMGANINADVLENETLLTFMARSDSSHDGLFEFLLTHGADPNKIDKASNTPLKVTVLSHDYNKSKLLLEHGANPNFIDRSQNRPILDSVASNDFDITLLLVDHGDKLYPSNTGYSVQYAVQHFGKDQYLSADQKENLIKLKGKLESLGYTYAFPEPNQIQKAIYDGLTREEFSKQNTIPTERLSDYYDQKYQQFIQKIDSGKLKYQDITK